MKRLSEIVFAFTLSVGVLAAIVWLGRATYAVGPKQSTEPKTDQMEVYSPSSINNLVDENDQMESNSAALVLAPDDVVLNCRFGYNTARRPITFYDTAELARLRSSWFSNWVVEWSPETVNGMEFVQTVRLHQTKTGPNWNDPYVEPYTYTIQSPPGATLAESLNNLRLIAAANPGLLWVVGNEIEREDWTSNGVYTERQDEILPELYAVAYHQIQGAIRAGDPTAQVAIGGLIQATPLRLQYLDRVWNEYVGLYGVSMPVDVWNIHAFVLPERRHYEGCTNCWGAGVPAGIEGVWEGELYTAQDNKDFGIAREHLIAFREWMRDKGQRNKPLIISEYGVLMPPEYSGFSFEEVRDEFMYPSFDFLLNQKDPDLGYPADDNRLVQRVLWFSLDYDKLRYDSAVGDYVHFFNGYLFYSGLEDGQQPGMAELGMFWEAYVTDVPLTVDLRPAVPWSEPIVVPWTGEPVTATIDVEISNSGSISVTDRFTVEFHEDGGPLIGADSLPGLAGCGEKASVQVQWRDLTPGLYFARMIIDPDNDIPSEVKEGNNEKLIPVLVGTQHIFVPVVYKSSE
jgi:hypothetical protein